MKEFIQAGIFYKALSKEQKKDLAEAIAADIFFLEKEQQLEVLELFAQTEPDIAQEIKKINNFAS